MFTCHPLKPLPGLCWSALLSDGMSSIRKSASLGAPAGQTLSYLPEIYTTNAIEFLSSVIRKATKQRNLFPADEAAMKVVYLTIQAVGCFQKMDDAYAELEVCNESFYDRIW